MNFKNRILIGVTFSILGVPVFSMAQGGNIHFGRTEVHPGIKLAYTYDDNVYLTNGSTSNDVSSSILTVSPSLQLKNEGKRRIFYLDYGAKHSKYFKDGPEDRTSHSLSLGFEMEFPGGLMLKLRDSYIITDDPASSELTDKDERTQHYFFAEVGSKVYDRLSFHINYGGTVHDYDEFALRNQDRSVYTVGGRMELRLLPKTSFFFGYSRTDSEYDTAFSSYSGVGSDVRDSKSENVRFGMKGDVTSKLTLNAYIGHQRTVYKQAGKRDFSSLTANLTLNHNTTAFTKFSLSFLRTFTESFYTDGSNTYNHYIENRISLGIDYKISHKLGSKFGIYYGINDYPAATGIDREDKLFGANLGLDYNIQPWLAVGAAYQYQERDSDANDGTSEEYKNNQYSAFIKASF